jgi:hypothetical protein
MIEHEADHDEECSNFGSGAKARSAPFEGRDGLRFAEFSASSQAAWRLLYSSLFDFSERIQGNSRLPYNSPGN